MDSSPRSTAFFASSPAPSISEGFDVFVQLVIAAITTEPFASSKRSPLFFTATCLRGGAFHGFRKRAFDLPQRHAILRPLGSGQRRLDLAKIELERVGKYRIRRLVGAEKPLHLGVGFDQRHALGASSR